MRVFGLIGYPLSHSFSKKYFLKKFKDENITEVEYHNFPIRDIKFFPEILNSDENIAGFNVTSPYKETVIPYLDELDVSASEINAVNVIKILRKGSVKKLIGYNTDVYGFGKSLQKEINPEIKSALIFGTGGAAKAVSSALKKLNIKYKFVSETKKNGNEYIAYSDLTGEIISENLLLINATPLGMAPKTDSKPNIPYSSVSKKHHLFDLIYNPPLTQFLSEGKMRNATIQNGLEMLHFQAEKAWEIFNNS